MLLYVTLYRVHFGPLIGYHFSANPQIQKETLRSRSQLAMIGAVNLFIGKMFLLTAKYHQT